jgi:predicted nucleic acid-binding protein
VEDLDELLASAGIRLVPIPRPALFLAGKAFLRYPRSGGGRTGVRPDFFVGAHAVASNAVLITRDTRLYRTYFPGIALIVPN